MANINIFSKLFSSALFTITSSGIVTGSSSAVPSMMNVAKVMIRLEAKLLRHMMENGNTVVDARIVMPTTIDVSMFCQTLDELAAVNGLFEDRSNLYTLTTKNLTFGAMMLESEKISQTPQMLSASPIKLIFKEVLVENTPPIIFAQPADSSLIHNGLLAMHQATQNVTDLIASIKASAATAVSRIF